MRTQTGNQKGFSLIELMVVVGIIGILAAIAVPNYQKFQAKSRQTEAKSNLGALYTAEKAFYAEWNRYFAAFRHIGYAPEGNLRFSVGFASTTGPMPANMGYTGPGCTNVAAQCTASTTGTNSVSSIGYCPTTNPATMASSCVTTTFAAPSLPTSAVAANGQTFTASARGNIDADSAWDEWSINHAKNLVNTNPDLAAD